MTEDNVDLDTDAVERLAFWSEFLNTEEGRLIVGDLGRDELKHFHADGFLYELRRSDEDRILVKLVGRD
ncbi:MAG: hypothetical protein ACXABV_06080 [Candidatus Thorarchaeota archaeon]|jgi:hypothetical protein